MPKAVQGAAKAARKANARPRLTRTGANNAPGADASTGGDTQPLSDHADDRIGAPLDDRVDGASGPAPDSFRAFLQGAAARLRRAPAWWPVPLCLALGAAAGSIYAAVAPEQYTATSYVVVSPGKHADPTAALGYAQAYGKIATDPLVLATAENDARITPGSLTGHVEAKTSPDAPMVQITGTSDASARAADYADAVAKSLTSTAKKTAKNTGVKLTVVSHAVAPADPVSPSTPLAVAVGGCAGGLVGALALLARPQRRRDGSPVPAWQSAGAGAGDGPDPLTTAATTGSTATTGTAASTGTVGKAGSGAEKVEAAR